MRNFEFQTQAVEHSYTNIFGLKVSDDVLAVILITLFVFIVGGLVRWLYNKFQTLYQKKQVTKLVFTSITIMEERIDRQLSSILDFVEVLKDKNLKNLDFQLIIPYQLKSILAIPNYDLFIAYKNDSAKYNKLITNMYLIDSLYDEIRTLYDNTKKSLFGFQDKWYKSVDNLRETYDKLRIELPEGDIFFNTIKQIYVGWAKYGDTKDLYRAKEFLNNFIVNCKDFLPDERALSLLHLAYDSVSTINNYQSKTVFYSEAFNTYHNTLLKSFSELKSIIS